MTKIKRVNNRQIIDYMARDYESFKQAMIDLIPSKLPEWTDRSEADFGIVLIELCAYMADILSYYQDRVANESFLSTAQTRQSIIHHLRLIGYRLATAVPASTVLTITLPDTWTETITIKKGDAFATKSSKDKPSVRFEYAREEDIEIDPTQKKVWYLPVEEGRLIKNEMLGTSDESPNQKFPLGHPGLIVRSLGKGQRINRDVILLTDLGGTIEEWTMQESLAFSRENQKDYIIDIDEEDRATVLFGDGLLGAIPPPGATIKVTYRVGGGRHGNVPAGSIKDIVDASQLTLAAADVINERPATGGAGRETIEHAVMHAPNVFRSLKRAVTADDYKALALDFNGVGKVRAEDTNWNTVTLFVAPAGGGCVSDILRANLIAYFEDKRPLSTIVEIVDVDYVRIYVTATVGVSSYYSDEAIIEQVQEAVRGLLDFEKVDFGETIYLSKFYEAIEAIDGVDHMNINEFRKESEAPGSIAEHGKIILGNNQIPKVPNEPKDPNDPHDDAHYKEGIRVLIEEGS